MTKRWLDREGERWIAQGIITAHQLAQLQSLYTADKSPKILPLLASILIGLGALSYVAANWQHIHEWLRITMLLSLMTVAYVMGQRIYEKNQRYFGLGLIAVGLFLFGGSIVLVGQMYHMVAHHALSMIVWAMAGLLLAFLYRSAFLGVIALLLLNVAQMYSVVSFSNFSWFTIGLLALSSVPFWLHKRNIPVALVVVFTLTIVLQSILFLTTYGDSVSGSFFFLILAFLYMIGDFPTATAYRSAFFVPVIAIVVFCSTLAVFTTFRVLDDLQFLLHFSPQQLVIFLLLWAIVCGISIFLKIRANRQRHLLDWLVFLPWLVVCVGSNSDRFFEFLLPWIGYVMLLVMWAYAITILLEGYALAHRQRIGVGTALFLLTTTVAFFELAWDFMDKSLVFIVGGLLLFGLSVVLSRKRKQVLHDDKGGMG
jgi:uncharacterized membrane protein